MVKNGYTVTEIKKNIFMLDENATRAFLILGDGEALMVDTGLPMNDIKGVTDELTDMPITVIQTHADGDHTGHTALYKKVLMHRDERPRFDREVDSTGLEIGYVEDGDVISVGEYNFTILHVPGHTEGSIVLFEKDKRFLIAGDSVQKSDVFLLGPGRSLDDFMTSMERLISMADGIDEIYPAHGEYPQPPSIMSDLLECGKLYKAGKLTGTKPGGRAANLPGKIYWNGPVGLFIDD